MSFGFWMLANGRLAELKRVLTGQSLPQAKPQERQAARDTRVSRIRISPDNVTARIGETVRFAAIAYDQEGDTIGGVKFSWSAQGGKEYVGEIISPAGEFTASVDGKFNISVEGAGQTAQTEVTVLMAHPSQRDSGSKLKTCPRGIQSRCRLNRSQSGGVTLDRGVTRELNGTAGPCFARRLSAVAKLRPQPRRRLRPRRVPTSTVGIPITT